MWQESLWAVQHRREGFALVRGTTGTGLIPQPLAKDGKPESWCHNTPLELKYLAAQAFHFFT